MSAKKDSNGIIIRSDFDHDIFYLCYTWRPKNTSQKLCRRIACSIHIDDIEGMFGEAVHKMAKGMKPGSQEFMPL